MGLEPASVSSCVRTLVSMATYSSHMVIMGKTLAPSLLIGASNEKNYKALYQFEIRSDSTKDCGSSCP